MRTPSIPAASSTFGYRSVPVPKGSVPYGPMRRGDQGISAAERPYAERLMQSLFTAPGVHMLASYDQESGTYEIRSRTGSVRWERLRTPDGRLIFQVVSITGDNPIKNVDGRILHTLEEEAAAGDGVGTPVREENTSYPDILRRITQLFDSSRAPEFVYIPTTGGDPNHPGAGSHGIPDMTQSRAPLIMAGPGVAANAMVDRLTKSEDVAPTVAEYLGVRPIVGTNGTGIARTQLLKWQDGHSFASAISDARIAASGVAPYGIAQRAMIITVDGMSQPAMLDEVRKGNLPNIARLMRMGTTMRNGTLVEYPTVTWANHNALVTGAAPGHTEIVNNSWYDRSTRHHQLITDGGFKNALRTGRLMSPEVETLYEAVERSFPNAYTAAINQPSGRGADFSLLDLTGLQVLAKHAVSMIRNYFGNSEVRDKRYQSVKEYKGSSFQDKAASAIDETLYSKKQVPKLSVTEFTLVDSMGHHVGPHAPGARAALQEVDRNIGLLLDKLDKRGLTDSTLIVVTADHGMETQERDARKAGGWAKALDASGVKNVESTRFVYVRNMRVGLDTAAPAAGTSGAISLTVVDDDADETGKRPPLAGAKVTITDGHGGNWTAVADAQGHVSLPVSPSGDTNELRIVIEHPSVTTAVSLVKPGSSQLQLIGPPSEHDGATHNTVSTTPSGDV